MKNSILKFLMIFVVSSLILVSCNENDSMAEPESFTEEETISLVEADDVINDVNSLIDDFLVSIDEEFAAKSEGNKPPYLSCMIKTKVDEGSTTIVTLDFGKECTLPFDNVVLSGKIIMEYEKDKENHSMTITYTYDDFYYNDLKIEGENKIVKIRENEYGFRQSTRDFDIKVIWPDEEFTTRIGSKVRVFIEGFDTRGNWGDNVFSITGSWTTAFKNGKTLSALITVPLIRKTACRFIVSGVIEKQKNGLTGTLYFGDGTCDNVAIFKNNEGVEKEVVLRKRHRKIK